MVRVAKRLGDTTCLVEITSLRSWPSVSSMIFTWRWCQERYDKANLTLLDTYLLSARHFSANEAISLESWEVLMDGV